MRWGAAEEWGEMKTHVRCSGGVERGPGCVCEQGGVRRVGVMVKDRGGCERRVKKSM